jgi:hypothetical protein
VPDGRVLPRRRAVFEDAVLDGDGHVLRGARRREPRLYVAIAHLGRSVRSDGAGPFDGYRSGSRIQLSTVTTADGARWPTGYHDAQLGVDCYVITAGDGALRCVPSAMAYVDGYFADASCSTPLALAVGCVAPAFAETTSGSGASYYRTGAAYSGATYYGSGSSCTEIAAPTFPLYRLGAPVPARTFAPVTVTH